MVEERLTLSKCNYSIDQNKEKPCDSPTFDKGLSPHRKNQADYSPGLMEAAEFRECSGGNASSNHESSDSKLIEKHEAGESRTFASEIILRNCDLSSVDSDQTSTPPSVDYCPGWDEARASSVGIMPPNRDSSDLNPDLTGTSFTAGYCPDSGDDVVISSVLNGPGMIEKENTSTTLSRKSFQASDTNTFDSADCETKTTPGESIIVPSQFWKQY